MEEIQETAPETFQPPMHPERQDTFERPGAFFFLTALRKAAARPVLWIASCLAVALLAGGPALASLGWFEGAFNSGTAGWRTLRETGAALGSDTWTLSETFRHDNQAGLSTLSSSTARSMAVLAGIAILLGVFAAGGWLQIVLERVDGKSFRRFCFGGARYFWRFLRVLVLVALLLSLVRWVFYGSPWQELVLKRMLSVPDYDLGRLSSLESEMQVARLGWLRDGGAALGFALVLVWGMYTRTRMALRNSRSAFNAGTATFFLMLRHPIQLLRPVLLLFLLQALIVVVAAGWFVDNIDARALEHPRIEHVIALLAVAQLAALWRHLTRGAMYFATVGVSQYLVPPHKKKGDPWDTSIGGPGGPQYPVGDAEDGYHVAL